MPLQLEANVSKTNWRSRRARIMKINANADALSKEKQEQLVFSIQSMLKHLVVLLLIS